MNLILKEAHLMGLLEIGILGLGLLGSALLDLGIFCHRPDLYQSRRNIRIKKAPIKALCIHKIETIV